MGIIDSIGNTPLVELKNINGNSRRSRISYNESIKLSGGIAPKSGEDEWESLIRSGTRLWWNSRTSTGTHADLASRIMKASSYPAASRPKAEKTNGNH